MSSRRMQAKGVRLQYDVRGDMTIRSRRKSAIASSVHVGNEGARALVARNSGSSSRLVAGRRNATEHRPPNIATFFKEVDELPLQLGAVVCPEVMRRQRRRYEKHRKE